MAGSGILYVVATPIGNLEDITLRALRILKEVDLIAAEDTRRTRVLLAHFGIAKPLVSYYDAVERRRAPELVARLTRGDRIALICDAGTPALSDPGYRLVTGASEAGIAVVPIPGPSALTAALAVAGLPSDRFVFEGFLPARGGARARRLEALRDEPRTIVFFEAPHRLASTLEALCEVLGDERPVVLARELTKRFEEVRRGTLSGFRDTIRGLKVRGEVTLVVAGADAEQLAKARGAGNLDAAIRQALKGTEAKSVRDIVKHVAAQWHGPRREIYRRTLTLVGKRGRR
jgi:16S rRNA (cytidine1402-2'-O)-methyltransferase